MEIRKIENSFYQSNTYVLLADKCAWLVDIGDAKPVIDLLRLEGKELLGVFLTHTHFDHIYGLNEIAEAYPGMKVYTSYNGMQACILTSGTCLVIIILLLSMRVRMLKY